MQEVYILAAQRTPMGSFMGAFTSVPAPRLGAAAIRAAVSQAQITPETVNQVILGNVLQAGLGQAPARQAAIHGGIPKNVGAVTVHKVCGSGMRAIMDAANGLRVDEWSVAVAGGMESMSNAPHLLERSRLGFRMGDVHLADSMIKDGLWDPYGDKHMGSCAELCAQKYNFTREAQDAYALTSYKRAQNATHEGLFKAELASVDVPQRKGDPVRVDQDEEPFRAPLEKMPQLRPAFEKDGTITAANASKINDGAAALVLASGDAVQHMNAEPIARLVAQGSFAQEPEWFTTAPVGAAQQALKRAGLTSQDIDQWEVNEAFAVVAMAFTRELDLNPDAVNARGGAVALGHPIGCSGARIVTTLLHTLQSTGGRYGVAAICLGGGEGTALVVENLKR